MSDEKKQKFTGKVRRGLHWVHEAANAELERLKATAVNGKVPGFTSATLSDIDAALMWIEQNKGEGATCEAA